MAQQLEVADLLEQECGKMSYGQRQRIAIIRALCQPFSFLLMDLFSNNPTPIVAPT